MAFLQEYTMLDELGKGGFASVYKVRHNELGYVRAVRVLNEIITDSSSKTYQNFLRECKTLLRLGNGNHPNIVHIYQPRLLANKALVEMDYVDGMDILHYLKQNQNFVPTEEVLRMATQMSSALAYCHEDIYKFCMDRDSDGLQDDPEDGSKVLIDDATRARLIDKYKVIHNDIHSGNIMRREDGNFVLLDFGLAINGNEIVHSSRHTNGAPEFKAPEKWDDATVLTEQSDIYSFGVVLYQYLAGRVPFPYDTRERNNVRAEFKLSEAHQKATPPTIEGLRKAAFEAKYEGQEYKKDYPEWLEEAIFKCLEKNPEDRFKNGKELYEFIASHATFNDKELKALAEENAGLQAQITGLEETIGTMKANEQTRADKDKEADAQLRKTKNKLHLARVGIVAFSLAMAIGGAYGGFWWERHLNGDISSVKAREEIILLQDKLNSQTTLNKDLQNKIDELSKNDMSGIEKENKKLRDENASLKKETNNLQDKLNSQTNLNKDLQKKIDELSKNDGTIKKLSDQIMQLQNKINSLEKTVAEKEAKINELQKKSDNTEEINSLTRQVQQKQKEINQLKEDKKTLEDKNKKLDEALKNCLGKKHS